MPTDVAAPTRTVTGPVVLYWVAFLGVGLSVTILGPAVSELRDRSGADIGSIGSLFAGQAVGYIVGSFVGGRLYDRFVGHRVFAGSMFVVAAGLLTVPWLETLPPLFLTFVVVGVGASTADVGANAMLMWDLGPAGGRSMNILHLCFGLGALAAPLLVHGGVDLATRVAAVVCVLIGLAALRVRSPVARPVTEEQDADPSPRLLALSASFFMFYVGLEVGYAGWVPTYGEELGFSASEVTWLTALFWIGFNSGRVLASAIAPKVRPKTVLVAACALTIAASLVLVVGNGAAAAVWVGTGLFGLVTAPQFPVMLNYLERRIHVTGYATSWFVGAAGVGGLIFPWVIGQCIDVTSESALPWLVLVLGLATAASFALTNRRLGG